MDTTPEQAAEGSALVRVLAAVLDRLVCANAPLALADPGQVTKFHALKAPGIGVLQYLERIHKYASCSNECFVLALIYIDRLIQRNNFLLTELNVHRVVITAILLGAKFFDDAYYNNAYYAKVGGVLVSEMNGLEVDFLFRINFSLHVTPDLFHKYRAELVSHSFSAGVTLHAAPSAHSKRPLHVENSISATNSISAACAINRTTSSQPKYQQRPAYTAGTTGKRNPNFITPSPPGAARPTSYPSDPSSSNCSSPSDSESNHLYYHQSAVSMAPTGLAGAMLASTNPVVSTYPRNRRCSPQQRYHPNASGSMGSMDSNDQYVVIDSMAYPFHGGMVHHHKVASDGALGDIFQHHLAGVPNGYHQHQYSDPGFVNGGDSSVSHFVSGHMLTGSAGGM